MRAVGSVLQWPMILWCMLYGMQAFAIEKKTREVDWQSELGLSVEQVQKIDAIEAQYRAQRKAIARDNCDSQNDAITSLQQQMRLDVRSVLSPQQAQKSDVVVSEIHRNMQLRHAREIAHTIGMSREQKEKFLTAVSNMQEDYQWPLDLDLRERSRSQFESLLNEYATTKQKEQWLSLKEQSRGKWHTSEEYSKRCSQRISQGR